MPSNPHKQPVPCYTAKIFVILVLIQAALCSAAKAEVCDASDLSATFSTQLSLPPARIRPWTDVREAILHTDYKQAENLLQKAPSSASRWFWEGVLLLHERRTFASIRSLERAARIQDDSKTETLLAVDYFLLNQRRLTADALNHALQLDPHDLLARYLRGRLAFASDSFDKARRDFATVLAQEPNDYHSLYYLGFSEWRMGLNSAARKDLQHTVDVLICHRLDFPLAPYALSQIEFNAGDAGPALSHSNLALKMAESVPATDRDTEEIARILTLRGKIEDHIKRSAEAERDLERAVKLNPYSAEGWYLLSHLYREQGKPTQAMSALKHFQQLQRDL